MSISGLLGRALLLVPAAIIAVFAAPKFVSGLALDLAFPVPVYLVTGVRLSQDTLRATYDVLAGAGDVDPSVRVTRAEAAAKAGLDPAIAIDLARTALKESPAQQRGWLLLAQTANPATATRSLTMSTYTGPFEYYSLPVHVRATQRLLPNLGGDDRKTALRQVKQLWLQEMFHPRLYRLMATKEGAAVMWEATKDDFDEVRAINRWVAAENRRQVRVEAKKDQEELKALGVDIRVKKPRPAQSSPKKPAAP